MLLGRGGITLNSFCFKLYIKDTFLGLIVRVRARIYCILVYNLALLVILISTQLISTILYSKYNNRYTTIIEDRQGGLFYIYLGP